MKAALYLGRRRTLLLIILSLFLLSYAQLNLRPSELIPGEGGRRLTLRFFAAALQPDLSPHVLRKIPAAVLLTLRLAFAATGLAIVFGLLLGFLGSTAWWSPRPGPLRRLQWLLYAATRTLISLLRSVHELLWAVLFLAAFQLSPATAVISLTLPFTGTLAKIYAEMIDERQRQAGHTLQAIGALPTQIYLLAYLPLAFADLVSYTLYRLECGIRASAIMGFMGLTTLGYFLRLAYENLHFAEVWTWLYVLILLVLLFETISAHLRRCLHTPTSTT